MVHHDDPVGQFVGLVEVLRGEEQRRPRRDQVPDDVPHPDATGRVESGGRFVEEEDGRAGDQAGREVEASTHAAGVALQHPICGVGQVELRSSSSSARRSGVDAAETSSGAHHDQVLATGQELIDRRVLGGDPDVAPHGAASGDDVVPGHAADPAFGIASVVRMRTAVVLPAPLGPSTPRIEPAGTSRSMPARATVSPNRLVTLGVDHRILRHGISFDRGCVFLLARDDGGVERDHHPQLPGSLPTWGALGPAVRCRSTRHDPFWVTLETRLPLTPDTLRYADKKHKWLLGGLMSAKGSATGRAGSGRTPGPPTRRRGSQLETALLDAAWAELTAFGYHAFTMEGVANRANTGRAVLYRRWSNRPDLAMAAIRHHSATTMHDLPNTGTLRGDVLALLRQLSASVSEMTGVLSFMFADYFDATGLSPSDLRERLLVGTPSRMAAVIQRAVERGEIDPDRLTRESLRYRSTSCATT